MTTRVQASDGPSPLDVFVLEQGRKVQERTDRLHDFIPFMRTSLVGIAHLGADMEGISVKASAKGIQARVLYLDSALSSLVKSIYHVAMGAFFSLLSLFALRKSSFLNQTAHRQWEQTAFSIAAVGIGGVGLFSPSAADRLNWEMVRAILSFAPFSETTSKQARLFFVQRAWVLGQRLRMIKEELLLPTIALLERNEKVLIEKNELIALIQEGKGQAHGLMKESSATLSALFAPRMGSKMSLFEEFLQKVAALPPVGVIASPLSLWKEKEISFSQFHRSFFACIDELEEIEGYSLARKLAPLLEREGVSLNREEIFTLLRDLGEEMLPLLYEFHQNGGAELFADLKDARLRPYALEEIGRGLSLGMEKFSGEIDQAEAELLTWAEGLSEEEIGQWAVRMKKEKEKALEEVADMTDAQQQLFEQYRSSLALFRVSMSSLRHLSEAACHDREPFSVAVTSRLCYLETILPSLAGFAYSCAVASITTLLAFFTLFQNEQLRASSAQRCAEAGFSLLAISLGLIGIVSPDSAALLNKKVAFSRVVTAVEEWKNGLEPDLQEALADRGKIQVSNLRRCIEEKFAQGKGGLFTKLFNYAMWSDKTDRAHPIEDFGKGHQVSLLRAFKNGSYHLFWGSCKTVDAASRCFLAKKKNEEMAFHWQRLGGSLLESMIWTIDQCNPAWGERARYFLFEEWVKLKAKGLIPVGALTAQEKVAFYFANYRQFAQEFAQAQAEEMRKQVIAFVKQTPRVAEQKPSLIRRALTALV